MLYIEFFSGRLRISLWLVVVLCICAVFFSMTGVAAFLLALFIHECAHVVMAAAMHMEISRMTVLPFGCEAEIDGFGNAYKEALCASAGPAVNLLTAALMKAFPDISFSETFLSANIAVAAINFLPALPLDGGRIIYAGLKSITNEKRAKRILYVFGVIIGSIMLFLFVFSAISGAFNITVCVMALFMLLHSVSGIKNAGLAFFKSVSEKRERLMYGRSIGIKHVALHKNTKLYDAVKEFDSKKINIIYVLDDNMNIIDALSESMVLSKAASQGSHSRLGELTLTKKSGKISCGIKES